MKKYHALPALPLITHDPYFSLWDLGPSPVADEIKHWSGVEKSLRGTVTIDGLLLRWLGRVGRRPMHLKEINVTPLSTEYVMEELGVRLTVRFTSPLLIDDFDIMSTPISYVDYNVEFIDGKDHEVTVSLAATESVVCDGSNYPEVKIDFFHKDGVEYGFMGQQRQKPLSGSGDHITQDWGYLWMCGDEGCVLDDLPISNYPHIRWMQDFNKPGKATLLIGYDDIASINYFGRLLPAYYARNGKTIVEALTEFHHRHNEIMARCDAFDKKLLDDARALGGEDYANIIIASYRQSIAGHKLVEDLNGDLLFISKENDSNGCAATVDVSYAGIAMYLYYSPELVRAMLRPALKFARMPVWIHDFCPHDVGRYPILTGQIYASHYRMRNASEGAYFSPLYMFPDTVEAYDFRKQLPVEECGNMILMLAGAAYIDGDYSLCAAELDNLRKWCAYLLKYGKDPEEQLCTDDFTGHLAHNANLAAKAVMGIAAFSQILKNLGHDEEAAEYWAKAEEYAAHWMQCVWNGSYSYQTMDGKGWSIKYNLIWDRLFDWGLIPDEFYEKELRSYVPRINEYGLPLDGRADYTKPEWSMYVAAMAVDMPDVFPKMVAPMAKFLAETPNRVPFSDLYDTVTGFDERFIARTVSGGTFMPLVMKQWQKKRNG